MSGTVSAEFARALEDTAREQIARADAAEAKLREIREVLAAGGWGNDPDAKEYVPMATQLDRINEIVEREVGAE